MVDWFVGGDDECVGGWIGLDDVVGGWCVVLFE